MSLPTSAELATMTPMMRQYFELKKQVDTAILFFRMGDFYEIFGEDANEVAPKLQLVLTSRVRGGQSKIPFCGVPHHSAKTYWNKLVKLGYRVGIVDQTEDASQAKGLVKREITKILTPGCIEDPEALEANRPNYLMAVHQNPNDKQWCCAMVEVSTGDFRWGTISGLQDVDALIGIYQPCEILIRRFQEAEFKSLLKASIDKEITLSFLPEATLDDNAQQICLIQQVFGMEPPPLENLTTGGMALVAGVIKYLIDLKSTVNQFLTIRPLKEPKTMALGNTTIRDLELFETTQMRRRQGSLVGEIDRTATPMGSRRLHLELRAPLLHEKKILQRQQFVGYIMQEPGFGADIRNCLAQCHDVERLTTKLLASRASPTDLVRLKFSLENAHKISENLASLPKKIAIAHTLTHNFTRSQECWDILDQTISDDAGCLSGKLDVFLPKYDTQLDHFRNLAQNSEEKLRLYEDNLRKKTGISSLKIKNHKTFGLLIEVTKSNLGKVPENFIRRQTMVNGERFLTDDLLEMHEEIQLASEKAILREQQLFDELLTKFLDHKETLRKVSEGLAMVDLLQSFAKKADESDYRKPETLEPGGRIEIKGSRHPVVESFVGRHQFVSNDLDLWQKQVLITGPNMAGKSTIMRQVALLGILHQIGSFVPASQAKIPIFDNIFTRVGASDNLSQGKSTFMVEMSESAAILRKATPRSLVIFDEVGRGTSTTDGLAIASAILEDLCLRLDCYTLFATHYHELVGIAKTLKKVGVMKTEVIQEKTGLVFTHRLVKGSAESSYGIEAAKLAGIPQGVLNRAESYLKKGPTSLFQEETSQKIKTPPMEAWGTTQVGKTSENEHLLAAKIAKIPIHRITPLQALNILNDLKAITNLRQNDDVFQTPIS